MLISNVCLKGDENVGVALLTYPVLMASDILLYQVVLTLLYFLIYTLDFG